MYQCKAIHLISRLYAISIVMTYETFMLDFHKANNLGKRGEVIDAKTSCSFHV